MTATAVPLMKMLGLNESLIGSVTAFSAGISIALVLTVAYTSDRCQSSFGRRRPFILALGMLIGLCAVLLYISDMSTISLGIRQASIFIVIVLIDTIMISVETPLLAFTMETFNQKDREQIITGFAIFGGLGNILGIGILYFMSKQNALMLCLVVAFVTFMMNIISRSEVPLNEVKEKPELESMSKTLKSYIFKPKQMQWLSEGIGLREVRKAWTS